MSGHLYPEREAAQAREKRRARKRALLAVTGPSCSLCPAPAECLVAPDSSGYGDPSLRHRQGPSDQGLTAKAGRVFAAAALRTPMCRPCQARTVNRRLAEMRRRAA